jgi:hypothetical protein
MIKTKFLISKFDTIRNVSNFLTKQTLLERKRETERDRERQTETDRNRQTAELMTVHDKKFERGKQIIFFKERMKERM